MPVLNPNQSDIFKFPSGLAGLSYTAQCITDGAVGLWPLNETNFQNPAVDLTGNSNGSYVNSTSLISVGRSMPGFAGNNSVGFNLGTTSLSSPTAFSTSGGGYVSIPSVTIQNLADTHTIEIWAMPMLVLGGYNPLIFGMNNFSGSYLQNLDGEIIANAATHNPHLCDGFNFNPILNLMFHCLFTKNGANNINLYINGMNVTSQVTNYTIPSAGGWYIGYTPQNNQTFTGYLAMAAIYPTALTATQALNHYRLGAGIYSDEAYPFLSGKIANTQADIFSVPGETLRALTPTTSTLWISSAVLSIADSLVATGKLGAKSHALLTETFGETSTGKLGAKSHTTLGETFSASSSGVRITHGSASLQQLFDTTVIGKLGAKSNAHLSETFTGSVHGKLGAKSSATLAEIFSITSLGASGIIGRAMLIGDFDSSIIGKLGAKSSVHLIENANLSALAKVGAKSHTHLTEIFDSIESGKVGTKGAAELNILLLMAASGRVDSAIIIFSAMLGNPQWRVFFGDPQFQALLASGQWAATLGVE